MPVGKAAKSFTRQDRRLPCDGRESAYPGGGQANNRFAAHGSRIALVKTQHSVKKLFLLDGMALIYRAHFALSKNPRYTAAGINTSAVMGFANTLMEILRKES